MKKLFLFLLSAVAAFGADAANDLLLSQRKADNTSAIQRNLAPVASSFLMFDSSKLPISDAGITYNAATDSLTLAGLSTSAGAWLRVGSSGSIAPTTAIPLKITQDGARVYGSFAATSATATDAPTLILGRGRGTLAAPAAVQANDSLGVIEFRGMVATDTNEVGEVGATFQANAAEGWTTTARGTYLRTLVSPTGSTTPAETTRWTAAGNLLIGTTSETGLTGAGGLKVASTTAATTSATGSGIFAGGIGVAGNSYFGGTLNVTGVATLGTGAILSTPASATLTNATGLPVGGISATGTPNSTTFLRGDGTWNAPAGSGAVATDVIWDAAGDLVQGTGANTAARLALGTANQLLRVNSGATAVEWATISSGGAAERYDGSFDGQGALITASVKAYRRVYTTGNIIKNGIVGDVSGAITITVKKYTPAAGALGSPTTLGTFALASTQEDTDTGLTWAVTAGDVLEISTTATITSVTKVFWSMSQ